MKKQFEISPELLPGFAEMLNENGLVNEIAGKTEDDCVLVDVYYKADQKGSILDLVEWLEDSENVTDDDDQDDDDQDDDDQDDDDQDDDDQDDDDQDND